MNLYKKLYESKQSKESQGINIFFSVFQHQLLSLIGLNILFVLSVLPVLTLGPGIYALMMTLLDLIKGEPIKVSKQFLIYYRTHFFQHLMISAGMLLLIILYFTFKANIIISLILVVIGLYFIFLMNLSICQYHMLALDFKSRLKNSILMTLVSPLSIGLWTITTVVPSYFLIVNWYIGSTFLLLIHFSLTGLITVFINKKIIYKYIIN